MSPPNSVSAVRRLLGMANQLGKFTPNLAELTKPLRELLGKSRAWTWGPAQSAAFKQVQEEFMKPTVLALYNPAAPTKVSADASSHGLGAVLLQLINDSWRPLSFASRSMSETERRYAQTEKEALAKTWACEKFANFLIGKHILVETDHKPLVRSETPGHTSPTRPTISPTTQSVRLCDHTRTWERVVHSRHSIKSPNIHQSLNRHPQPTRAGRNLQSSITSRQATSA